ncbi:Protein kinase domain-containing protein [Aphelenchoides besseyi]|nr:Protein kinase domain-containing protein [Aphelenchoides besseyi]
MGNSNQRQTSTDSPSMTMQDDHSLLPPPRKKAKGIRGSLSLRSIASFASSRFSGRSQSPIDVKQEIDFHENVARKRKYTDGQSSSSSSSGIIAIEKYWPALVETVFEPNFPWRSDICESDFIVLNPIGNGRFGTVFRAIPRTSSQIQVAVKIQDKIRILKAGAEDQIKNESAVQKLLGKNQFVAELYDCWQTSRELFTLMEYVDGYSDLYTLWSEYGKFSEELVCLYGAEIAFGIEYLHSQRVVHRDLKMENIALDVNLHIKLVDLGFAKHMEAKSQTKTICGTLQYMAPEIAHGKEYDYRVDWWSYAIILYVMRSGAYPFPNAYVTTHEELNFDSQPYPETFTQEFKDLMEKLLVLDPEQRISNTRDLFAQSFYDNVNIEGIFNRDVPPWEYLKCECKYAEMRSFKTSTEHPDPFSYPVDF